MALDRISFLSGRWGHDGITRCNPTQKGGRGREWINNNNKKKGKKKKKGKESNHQITEENENNVRTQQQQSRTMCVFGYFTFNYFRFHCPISFWGFGLLFLFLYFIISFFVFFLNLKITETCALMILTVSWKKQNRRSGECIEKGHRRQAPECRYC